jgi:hypothetical protein
VLFSLSSDSPVGGHAALFSNFQLQLLAQIVRSHCAAEAMSSCDWMKAIVQRLAGREWVHMAGMYLTGPFGLDEGGARTLRFYYCDSQQDLSRFLLIFHVLYFDGSEQRWTCHNKSACAVALARQLWREN